MSTTTDYRSYELTGDLLVDRAHYVAAGRPADHPYIVAPSELYVAPAGPVAPLVLELSPAQEAAMAVLSPVMRAQSDANVAALLGRAR